MRDDRRVKDLTLTEYIKHTKRLLDDFYIRYDEEIEERIISLYPHQVLIDNYVRDLIRIKLSDPEE